MNKVQQARQLLRHFGVGWLVYRLSYSARMKSGFIKRQLPAHAWADRPLAVWLRADIPSDPGPYLEWRQQNAGRFFFDTLPACAGNQEVVNNADAILAGSWPYFSGKNYQIGFPPDWHLNPETGKQISPEKHWSMIGDFAAGDIKYIWEASRFSVVFTLVRAYAASHDDRYAIAFWELVEDWRRNNPPQLGPNWKCGQETSLRLLAWCFGLYGFGTSAESTPERIAHLAGMIAVHAHRIERNIGYARSQKNNHALSEGVGLWTVGLLFPEFQNAAAWRRHGRQVIIEETARQIYNDGAYIQHSTNYHRVMLHLLVWALRLGELNDAQFPSQVYERVTKATDFLYQLLDLTSGQVPNYGANDGALVLPLSNCDYVDFRPVLQSAHYLCHQNRLLGAGPWDEELMWLFGMPALQATAAESTQTSFAAPVGGYYTLRSPISWAMTRCAEYTDRPGQADQLHMDLWWRGINIACDAGTYLYNGAPPWDNQLGSTTVHNTVNVDEQDQMTRVSRFMWLDWSKGTVQQNRHCQQLEYWEGRHDGYQRLRESVLHRRGILRIGDECWLILDALSSKSPHTYQLHWLFPSAPYETNNNGQLRLNTPQGNFHVQMGGRPEGIYSLRQGIKESVEGWQSLYYGEKAPANSWTLTVQQVTQTFFYTLFSPFPAEVVIGSKQAHIRGKNWQLTAELDPLLKSASLTGVMEDNLL